MFNIFTFQAYSHSIIKKILFSILNVLLIVGCASKKEQFSKSTVTVPQFSESPTHTFYLAGGYGNDNPFAKVETLKLLEKELASASTNSTLIYTGDNVYEKKNLVDEDSRLLQEQLNITSNFKGKTIFLPGENEWKSKNTDSIDVYDDFLKKQDDYNIRRAFEDSCPLEYIEINDSLDLILVNSIWFISNWDRIKGINKKCTDLVSPRRFAEELEGYINDAQGKNIVIAMHHPIFSNGKYAGYNTLGSQLLPFPVLGTLYTGVEDLGAFSPKHLNSNRYYAFRVLVSSLAQESDRITFVSGHENSLQYLSGENGTQQIVSGSLSSTDATRQTKDAITAIGGTLEFTANYTHATNGFAKLEYYNDGSSKVTFFSSDANENPKTFNVLEKLEDSAYVNSFPPVQSKTIKTAILEDKEPLDKSGIYKLFWGDRYRSYYGKEITANVADLTQLHGGLTVTKKGGGHQSYSLRLEDSEGREYAMRSLRKNALRFLKFKLKGIAYNEESYESSGVEDLTSDFFTSSHPFMQLVINPIAEATAINHASTQLYYVPKQETLGKYNDEFGDELYFIEERPSDAHANYEGYKRTFSENEGEIKDFESTTDMLEKIKRDESYTINQRAHIRARIFDMLIGDWDRHEDQWRWAEVEKPNGDKEFQSIPRDRDGSFAKFDGIAIPLIQLVMPDTRFWQTYDSEIKSVKWFNAEGNNLDRALFTGLDAQVWTEEAKYIQNNLTDEIIDSAFLELPKETQDETAASFKIKLKERLKNLDQFATEYGEYLDKTVAIRATNKDDHIEVFRMGDGKTRVVIKRILNNRKNELFYDRTFDKKTTNEVWIYGLNDEDVFKVYGQDGRNVFVRIIGGYGNDIYDIQNKSHLKIYDYDYEESSFQDKKPSTFLSDNYEVNTFHWRYFNENNNVLLPNLGFRTDDGIVIGLTDTYTVNGFNGNPFRQKHTVSAKYYSEFQGFDVNYSGIWANLFPKWNFELDAYATNDRYSTNFFGFGNDTQNLEDDLDRDFYRSRMRQYIVKAGIAYRTLRIKALYENWKVDEIGTRLFTRENLGNDVFESQSYVGGEVSLQYQNDDANDFPTRAFFVGFTGGYKANTEIDDNQFGYAQLQLSAAKKLIPSGNLVLSTFLEGKTNIGDDFFYYHAPSLGGNNGLRGFRDERFTGKTYFYQSSDLRLRLKRYNTAALPITIGLYGGFDYGRVWLNNDNSNQWHTSQGGGFWLSGLNSFALSVAYFNSDETDIIQLGFGFGF